MVIKPKIFSAQSDGSVVSAGALDVLSNGLVGRSVGSTNGPMLLGNGSMGAVKLQGLCVNLGTDRWEHWTICEILV